MMVVPDVEQLSMKQCPYAEQSTIDNLKAKAVINPLTTLDILYTNADQLVVIYLCSLLVINQI